MVHRLKSCVFGCVVLVWLKLLGCSSCASFPLVSFTFRCCSLKHREVDVPSVTSTCSQATGRTPRCVTGTPSCSHGQKQSRRCLLRVAAKLLVCSFHQLSHARKHLYGYSLRSFVIRRLLQHLHSKNVRSTYRQTKEFVVCGSIY